MIPVGLGYNPAMPAEPNATQAILDRHDAHLSPNYPRFPVAMVKGDGCTLTDAEGKRYLDLFAGFGAPILGHAHPELVEAVTQQAKTLWHVGNLLHTEPQTHAAQRLGDASGWDGRSFFSHSGADANEAAIKLARLYGHARPGPQGPRTKIISTTKSFHGRSFGTMGATGNPAVREGFGPLLPGFVNTAYNSLDAVREQVDASAVAIIVEPIQGEGGVNVPTPEYLPALRQLCDEHDLLLICDEVWTGCGRTGDWFAHQHDGITPDLMTLGKGVGGGLPVGVMLARPTHVELVDARKHGVKHATTLGGNALGMAVTAKLMQIIERDGLLARAKAMGEVATQKLLAIGERTGRIAQVRGRGLFLGVQLQGEGRFASASDVMAECLARGVLINSTGPDVLRIAPPLIVTESELEDGLAVVHEVLSA